MKRYIKRYIRAASVLSLAVIAVVLIVVLSVLPMAEPIAPGRTNQAGLPTAGFLPSPSPQPTVPADITNKVKIQFAGDLVMNNLMLQSAISTSGFSFDGYFDQLAGYLDGDLCMFNLEGVINGNGDGTWSGSPIYNYPEQILHTVKKAGFNTVITGNDKAYNCGFAGIKNTQTLLKRNNLDYIGTYSSADESCFVKNYNGINIGILSYTEGVSVVDAATGQQYVRIIDSVKHDESLAVITKDIAAAKAQGAEIILVSLHWGTELATAPTTAQKKLAQNIVEAGGDVILGTMSHCVQQLTYKTFTMPDKTEKNAVVAYSVGNLISHPSVDNSSVMQEGMLLNITVDRNESGKAQIASVGYVPTFTYVQDISGDESKFSYSVLPAGKYLEGEAKPDIFADQSGWTSCKNAFNNVVKRAGESQLKVEVIK